MLHTDDQEGWVHFRVRDLHASKDLDAPIGELLSNLEPVIVPKPNLNAAVGAVVADALGGVGSDSLCQTVQQMLSCPKTKHQAARIALARYMFVICLLLFSCRTSATGAWCCRITVAFS